jgi:hypothetical protein
MTGEYDGIVEQLRSIEEQLGDLAYERLRALAADPDGDGAKAVKAEERRLLQARRAIAKAIATLGSDAR